MNPGILYIKTICSKNNNSSFKIVKKNKFIGLKKPKIMPEIQGKRIIFQRKAYLVSTDEEKK